MKSYIKTIKLEGVTILDQCHKLNSKFMESDIVDLAIRYGGYSIIGDDVVTNYANYGDLMLYDNNDVMLILPPEVETERVNHIVKALQLLKVDNPIIDKMVGGWISQGGFLVEELNTVINFNMAWSELRWHFIYCLMRDIKLEYNQECTALRVNEALVLI